MRARSRSSLRASSAIDGFLMISPRMISQTLSFANVSVCAARREERKTMLPAAQVTAPSDCMAQSTPTTRNSHHLVLFWRSHFRRRRNGSCQSRHPVLAASFADSVAISCCRRTEWGSDSRFEHRTTERRQQNMSVAWPKCVVMPIKK